MVTLHPLCNPHSTLLADCHQQTHCNLQLCCLTLYLHPYFESLMAELWGPLLQPANCWQCSFCNRPLEVCTCQTPMSPNFGCSFVAVCICISLAFGVDLITYTLMQCNHFDQCGNWVYHKYFRWCNRANLAQCSHSVHISPNVSPSLSPHCPSPFRLWW